MFLYHFMMFGQKRLHFNVSGIHVCFGFFLIFSFNSFFLSNFSDVDYVCLESHTTRQHAMDKLFLAPFVKNQNLAYIWIKSLKLFTVCFVVC